MNRAIAITRDVAGLAGAGSITWGCYLIYPALGYIVAGAMLVAAAIWSALCSVAGRVSREF